MSIIMYVSLCKFRPQGHTKITFQMVYTNLSKIVEGFYDKVGVV